jgi:DNA-binding NtrC family response regulator
MAANSVEVLAVLAQRPVNLVLCEAALPGGGFRQVIQLMNATGLGIPLVVCSRLGEWDEYLEAMQLGAFDFIAAPYRLSEIEFILNRVRSMHLHKTMGGTGHNIQAGLVSGNDSEEVWPASGAYRCRLA